MAQTEELRTRKSILELQTEYEAGKIGNNKAKMKPLEDLMRAWQGIKDLPSDDPKSFFIIGGYHGEPFRGAGINSSTYWGGYCNHGNVLFPTWHRAYLLKLEEALQSIPGCEDVMMPYWDETNEESLKNGIPWALTVQFFPPNSKTPNPLRSFVFPKKLTDSINGDDPNYSKPAGYETVRYPLSGLVGTDADKAKTAEHNSHFKDYDENVKILNGNIVDWLTQQVFIKKGTGDKIVLQQRGLVQHQFEQCLQAPNYTVFSNTTSAGAWNNDENEGKEPIFPLESPHNSLHLAIGGCEVTGYNADPKIPFANGDMGENDTAGLDPIFYFHHSNIDRMFWIWQKRMGLTDQIDIIPEYPGTNTMDSQGPTPGFPPNTWLTMGSPLTPFRKKEDGEYFTSSDCVNIESQLGYTYSKGSMDEAAMENMLADTPSASWNTRMIRISAINRAAYKGSFMIAAYANLDGNKEGKKQLIGVESVLSRWRVKYCANCQTHLEVKANFSLPEAKAGMVNSFVTNQNITEDDIQIDIITHDGKIPPEVKETFAGVETSKKSFKMEIR